jgi:uncharacterized membrane protein HdeD (DUF308 family)
MSVFDHYFATRRNLKIGLAVAGAVAGAIFGVALTVAGKIVAGAPPATLANYAWNAGIFAVMAGIVSPIVTWSALRRAPLWRTVVEPLVLAVAGAATGVVVSSPVLLFVLPPVGLALGFIHLGRAHSTPERQ